jgi:hypothetical protein
MERNVYMALVWIAMICSRETGGSTWLYCSV